MGIDDQLTGATCNICGKHLTRQEFRASKAGHFCDEHRPALAVQQIPRATKQHIEQTDGNVAFKVTWVYGENGPFTTPCTPEGRLFNIRFRKTTWCVQPECPCKKLYESGNARGYDRASLEYWPCYDSAVFDKWAFGGGVFHGKSRRGDEIPFKNFQLGKLAFFTSRRHDMSEKERVIIGCYRIAKAVTDPDLHMLVAAAGDYKLKVTDLSQAPRFWEFHRQKGEPHWGTGLFRYLPDDEAQTMLEAVKNVATEVR